MKTTFGVAVVVGGLVVLLGGQGCGDSDEGSGSGGTTSSSSGTGATSAGGSSSSTSGSGGGGASSSSSSSTSGAGGGGGQSNLDECLAEAPNQPDPACTECACHNCLSELEICEADQTCVDLRDCAVQNDCCDELCVLTNCWGELDAAGGINGEGTARATAVRDCTETNTCGCCD